MLTRGRQFLNSLDDNRNVWLNGARVRVTEHPAFEGTLSTISALFDMIDDPAHSDNLGTADEKSGRLYHNSFLVPREREHLSKRGAAFRVWSESTNGVMSRLSDYARSRLTGWYATRERMGDSVKHYGEKLARYYEKARENDLFLSAVQREPQIDRSAAFGEDPDMVLRVVERNSEGLVLRGAKMIATAGPYSNDFLVYPLAKIPEEKPEYAHMMIVPAQSAGLHMMCRESFARQSGSEDYPLSSRYDEMDAVLFFDDVLVPWERVLIHDDPEALWKVRTDEASSSLAYHQAIIRLQGKLEFATGVAISIARAIGVDRFLNVQALLGELVSQIQTVEGLVVASEAAAKPDEFGNWLPAYAYIETARNLGSKYYPRAIEILQMIGGGGFLQVPSSLEELSGPLSPYIRKYAKGASVDAEEKARLFKLAWELIGSPLGSRQELYERFYSGDPYRNLANQYLSFDQGRLIDKVSKLTSN